MLRTLPHPSAVAAASRRILQRTHAQPPLDKRIATARARAALIGATLVESEDDAGRPSFLFTRWAVTRAFDRFDDVEVLLDLLGAPA